VGRKTTSQSINQVANSRQLHKLAAYLPTVQLALAEAEDTDAVGWVAGKASGL